MSTATLFYGLPLLTWTGIALILFSLFLICALCVPPYCFPPIGLISRLCNSILFSSLTVFHSLMPTPISSCFSTISDYIVSRSNPLMQIGYLLVMWCGFGLFVLYVYPFLLPSSPHYYIPIILEIICFISFVVASFSDPGVITNENVSHHLSLYPYDHMLYLPKYTCLTCENVPKPARSKHCALCNRCISRSDHHCIWLNNDIGLLNYRWFLSFVYIHLFFTGYGSWLNGSILYHIIKEHKLYDMKYFDHKSNSNVMVDHYFVFQWVTYYHGVIWGLFIICFVLHLLLIGFSSYHTFLALTNSTTNERNKIKYYLRGNNLHSCHDIMRITFDVEVKKEELRKIQKELLRIHPSLAKQHPQMSKDIMMRKDDKMMQGKEGAEGNRIMEREMERKEKEKEIVEGKREGKTEKEEGEGKVIANGEKADVTIIDECKKGNVPFTKEVSSLFERQNHLVDEISLMIKRQKEISDKEDEIYEGKPTASTPSSSPSSPSPSPPPLPPRKYYNLYDRGWRENIKEILFPHSIPNAQQLQKEAKMKYDRAKEKAGKMKGQ